MRSAARNDGSVAIRRVADYAVDYPLIPLEAVAGKTRVMEDHFINADGNDVTPRFTTICARCVGADMPRGRAAARGEGREGERPHGRFDLRSTMGAGRRVGRGESNILCGHPSRWPLRGLLKLRAV